MSEIRDRVITSIADFIGEGVHTGLRKWCESDKSHEAWLAIRDMPGEEWYNIALELAKYILEAVPELAIVDREAELPEFEDYYKPRPTLVRYEQARRASWSRGQLQMLIAGWVKEVRGEKLDR